MAFVANNDDEQNNQGLSPTSGSAVHLSPSSGVGTSTPGGSSAAPTAAQGAGGQFATLNTYLNANQGQAQPIANKITGQANQEYNSLNQGNQGVLQNLQGQVASGYTPNDPNLVAQEAASPVAFASDSKNVANFQKLLNDQYSGPTSAEGDTGYQKQQADINTAIAQGQSNTQTETGRQNLVQQNSAVPTKGVGALNNAILSNDSTALGQVENAYKPFQNLVTGLNTGAANVDTSIAKAQSDASAANQAANQAVTGQQSALNSAVTGELTAAQQAAAAKNAAVSSELTNLYGGTPLNTAATTLGTYGGGTAPWVNTSNYTVNALTPETASALGLSPDQATQLQNALSQAATSSPMSGHNFGAWSGTTQLDLAKNLTQADPNQAITAANIATPEQYAEQQAFQTLLGQLPTGAVLDPTQAAAAGTAPKNLNTFDYNTALSNAQQTAAGERQAAQDEANAISGAADLAHAQSQHGGGLFGNVLGTLGKYLANPLAVVPAQLNVAQNIANKAKKVA